MLLLNTKYASSGIAKTMEHLARVGSYKDFESALSFLEKRNYQKFKNFKSSKFDKFQKIYCEYDDTMYISLDTNTHLINAYLNFYEKII